MAWLPRGPASWLPRGPASTRVPPPPSVGCTASPARHPGAVSTRVRWGLRLGRVWLWNLRPLRGAHLRTHSPCPSGPGPGSELSPWCRQLVGSQRELQGQTRGPSPPGGHVYSALSRDSVARALSCRPPFLLSEPWFPHSGKGGCLTGLVPGGHPSWWVEGASCLAASAVLPWRCQLSSCWRATGGTAVSEIAGSMLWGFLSYRQEMSRLHLPK